MSSCPCVENYNACTLLSAPTVFGLPQAKHHLLACMEPKRISIAQIEDVK